MISPKLLQTELSIKVAVNCLSQPLLSHLQRNRITRSLLWMTVTKETLFHTRRPWLSLWRRTDWRVTLSLLLPVQRHLITILAVDLLLDPFLRALREKCQRFVFSGQTWSTRFRRQNGNGIHLFFPLEYKFQRTSFNLSLENSLEEPSLLSWARQEQVSLTLSVYCFVPFHFL